MRLKGDVELMDWSEIQFDLAVYFPSNDHQAVVVRCILVVCHHLVDRYGLAQFPYPPNPYHLDGPKASLATDSLGENRWLDRR